MGNKANLKSEVVMRCLHQIMLPYRGDIRKHPNVDDGVPEAGEQHGEVAHVHRAQPPLGVLGSVELETKVHTKVRNHEEGP